MKQLKTNEAINIIKKNNIEAFIFESTDKQKLLDFLKNTNQQVLIAREKSWTK